ncbi:hypothetical protein C2G38_2170194 [Gigaspora rosea]|uniref:Ion transport domain-containing protein n=1 Tax=Gigaspora rosea TaxID=44941 RepID=A0A397VV06_9GLOM|nr:hypothetical protein C2G38_2170194 [Gigaspora rosea]
MSNQSEHIVEIENKYKSVIAEEFTDDTRKNRYFAISPEGDFLVEFKEIDFDSLKFELKMYNIMKYEDDSSLEKDSKSENGSKRENEPDRIDEQESSYRKFSRIHAKTTLPFTETQICLIKNVPKPIVKWFVAVSNESTNSSKFRLLAISCISLKDMEYYKEVYKNIGPNEIQNIQNNGFTFVFIINNNNNYYSINNTEDKELLIKYGGIVKLFYEKDHIADQDTDDHFLILLTLSGIYKYHMKNKSTYSIQKLKYPKRIYNSIISNLCVNKHYFLVDTIKEDIEYIEFYDLKTNQLVNIFLRQILTKSILVDLPSYYAISNNGKLLAYLSYPIKGIIIYSIECGLEIAELANILDTSIFKTIYDMDRIFLYFFHNDEKDSVKLNQQEFILEFPSINDNINRGEYVEKSNSCIPGNNKRQFVNQRNERYDKLFIYDDLVVDKYFKLKESDKQDWITRDLEDHTQEFKGDKLYEPWLPDGDDIQYSFYLDKKKDKLLIIRCHTVQVWYRGTLKFIHSPSPGFNVPDLSGLKDWKLKKIEVIGIEYCSEKFKFRIQIKNAEGIKQIKMDDEDDIMNLAKYACNTLEYFSVYKKKLYPTEWRLLDIRFDLMSTLVKAGEHELVYYILSFGELIHIPKYLPWSDKENKSTTISIALSDNTMLAYFLEYYSNNAIHNIGWMNTVVDIIPELFKSNDDIGIREKENYKFYAQKLFYSSCFCDKEFDLFSFEILEVSPKSNDLLKVYIPITQLIPQNSKLNLQEIDYDEIVNIRMVPLMDFTTNKKMPDIKKGKLTNFLETLFSPRRNLFILLGYSFYIGLNSTSEEPFSNIIDAILAVYDWSSISFDNWNFWPLTIISVIGGFIFVIILQNVIISFMAFSNVVEDSKRSLYSYQIDLIREFVHLENSMEFSDLDYKFRDKIRAKYICFYDDPNITKSWKEKSEQIRSKPYPKIQTLHKETLANKEDIYSLFSSDDPNITKS